MKVKELLQKVDDSTEVDEILEDWAKKRGNQIQFWWKTGRWSLILIVSGTSLIAFGVGLFIGNL